MNLFSVTIKEAGSANCAQYLTLPDDIKAKLLPEEQYKNVQPIKNADGWENRPVIS